MIIAANMLNALIVGKLLCKPVTFPPGESVSGGGLGFSVSMKAMLTYFCDKISLLLSY